MTYVTEEQAMKYTTFMQFEDLYVGLNQVELILDEKLTGGEETAENSTPIFGDIAIISANYDTSFFVRWECRDPRNRKMKFYVNVNGADYFFVNPWYNGNYYTCFIPKGHAQVGNNECKVYADNGVYITNPKVFNVTIPKEHVPQPPTISQDIQDINAKPGAVIAIRYIAADDGILRTHEFYNGIRTIDITNQVSQNGTQYEYLTSFTEAISISGAYVKVIDNEGLSAQSNSFKIIIT